MAKKHKKFAHPLQSRLRKTKQIAAEQRMPLHQRLLQRAQVLHREGRLPQAEALYNQILLLEPNHADALHFLGMLALQAGKSDIAIKLIRKALFSRPDYTEAYCNLGIILDNQGKPDEAIACFHQAIALRPDYAAAYWCMGNTLKNQGKLNEAAACFHRVLALNADHVEAYNNLGITLKDQDKLDEAAACFRQAVALRPEFAGAHYNLGNVLNEQGRLSEAAASFRRALALKPDYTEAYYNLGITLNDGGNPDEAAICFRKALSLNPDFAEAYNNLGGILNDQGKPDEAAICFRKTLSLKPDFAEAYNNLGGILNDQNKPDEAMACFRKALSLKPDYTEAHYNLGLLFSQLGKLDEAVACFRKVLAQNSDHAQAYRGLITIVKSTEADAVTYAMENLYTQGDLSDAERIGLGFDLGKVFEDLKNYDKSFAFILEANRRKRGTYEYSVEKECGFFERIKKTFSSDFFSSHPGSGSQDRTPIFILGMPRSGTTLIEQIIASHSLVFGAGELAVLAKLTNGIRTGMTTAAFPECIVDLGPDIIEEIGAEYIKSIRKYSNNAAYITDKMPDNFLRVGLIKTILPNAKVIHCVRNPMDTCFSIFRHDFSRLLKYAYNMNELGRYYNLYSDLMAHWEKVLPGFMYTIRYEELIANQQKQSKRLLDFCGLPWDRACLTFHKTARKVNTASLAQVRQPIYKDSVELWKRYEKQLEPLRKAVYG